MDMDKQVEGASAYFKSTIDRLLDDVKKTMYNMVDDNHVCTSPMDLLKDAVKHMDDYYLEVKNKREAIENEEEGQS